MPDKLCVFVCPFIKREFNTAMGLEGFENVALAAYPARCHSIPLQWDDIIQSCPNAEKYSANIIVGSYCVSELKGPPANLADCQIIRQEHCCSLFANREILNNYLLAGNYLLTPGWLAGWRKRLDEWGFESKKSDALVREFFNESIKKLLLLDTGVEEKSTDRLQDFAAFTGLAYDVLPVGLDYLRLFISKTVIEWQLEIEKQQAAAAVKESQAETAGYAMIMNVFGELAKVLSEADTIGHILDLFSMLFAPQDLYYLAVTDGKNGRLYTNRTLPDDDTAIRDRMANLEEPYAWTKNGNGFILQITYHNQIVGIIETNDITFPKYKERYLKLALSLVDVCGLAIDNARNYQKLADQKDSLAWALSELQETQQQLVESEKMAALGRLVAGIAHEINTPVGNSIMAASSVQDHTKQIAALYKDNKMTRSDLEKFLDFSAETAGLLMSNLQRTGELIHSFKQVSVDQTADQSRKFPLKNYLQDVIRSLKPNFKSKAIEVVIDCPKTLEINSYPGAFAQIISNLVLNSLRHGFRDKSAGKITITAGLHKNQLDLHYQDNGTGISPENLDKIFDPFFTTDKQTGSGLGLHIVYNIITHKLQGKIMCNSGPGNGALFNITVPFRQGEIHE